MNWKIGDRCIAFNCRLYKNDKDTPLSMTMCKGVITELFEDDYRRELATILFDCDPRPSRGHFLTELDSPTPMVDGAEVFKAQPKLSGADYGVLSDYEPDCISLETARLIEGYYLNVIEDLKKKIESFKN